MTAQTTVPAAEMGAGAASHAPVDWQAIDWPKAHRIVRRLQARIVQATQAGRWGKVKALQHLLTHSFSGKALAVRRVTENQGKRTAGVDRVTWDTPEQKTAAIHALRQRGYQPRPLRRLYMGEDNDCCVLCRGQLDPRVPLFSCCGVSSERGWGQTYT